MSYELRDLQFHRGEVGQGGGVAFAGRLAGGTQLSGRAGDERLGVQVLEDVEGEAQVPARVDPALTLREG